MKARVGDKGFCLHLTNIHLKNLLIFNFIITIYTSLLKLSVNGFQGLSITVYCLIMFSKHSVNSLENELSLVWEKENKSSITSMSNIQNSLIFIIFFLL